MRPVEAPFIILGQILSVIYFLIYFLNPIIQKTFDKLIYLNFILIFKEFVLKTKNINNLK